MPKVLIVWGLRKWLVWSGATPCWTQPFRPASMNSLRCTAQHPSQDGGNSVETYSRKSRKHQGQRRRRFSRCQFRYSLIAHGGPMLEQINFPDRSCDPWKADTRAKEKWEKEGAAERSHCVLTPCLTAPYITDCSLQQ